MTQPTLYRKRFIPAETVCLTNDIITHMDENVIVTTWRALKPRPDFATGRSCYFLKKGFKVSQFFDKEGTSLYHYCDIIHTDFSPATNSYTFTDLLVDVVIMPDGLVKVLDLGEVPEAIEASLIDLPTACEALRLADALLATIYAGQFHTLTTFLTPPYCTPQK